MDAIMNRRSVRSYSSQPISEEDMARLLRAAMRAPSAGNEQPWEFVVMRERENMVKIMEFQAYAAMLEEAACAVVVCGDTRRQKFPYDFWVQDCSAATQNLLVEAAHLGIGSVWLGVYPIEERIRGLQQLLGLPEQVIPLNVVALGYPKQQPVPLDTFLPERIHRERWGE